MPRILWNPSLLPLIFRPRRLPRSSSFSLCFYGLFHPSPPPPLALPQYRAFPSPPHPPPPLFPLWQETPLPPPHTPTVLPLHLVSFLRLTFSRSFPDFPTRVSLTVRVPSRCPHPPPFRFFLYGYVFLPDFYNSLIACLTGSSLQPFLPTPCLLHCLLPLSPPPPPPPFLWIGLLSGFPFEIVCSSRLKYSGWMNLVPWLPKVGPLFAVHFLFRIGIFLLYHVSLPPLLPQPGTDIFLRRALLSPPLLSSPFVPPSEFRFSI